MTIYVYYSTADCDNCERGNFKKFKNERLMNEYFDNVFSDSELRLCKFERLSKKAYFRDSVNKDNYRFIDHNALAMRY